MQSVYLICEKNGPAKILTLVRGTRIDAKAVLKRFSVTTTKEVYLLDVLADKVIARRNS